LSTVGSMKHQINVLNDRNTYLESRINKIIEKCPSAVIINNKDLDSKVLPNSSGNHTFNQKINRNSTAQKSLSNLSNIEPFTKVNVSISRTDILTSKSAEQAPLDGRKPDEWIVKGHSDISGQTGKKQR